jgi:hypothetical protein
MSWEEHGMRRLMVILAATVTMAVLVPAGPVSASVSPGPVGNGAGDDVEASSPGFSDASVFDALTQASTRLDACGPGACGSITWDFVDKYVLANASQSVKDTRCDAHNAYIEMRVHDAAGVRTVFELGNNQGCGETAVRRDDRYQSRTIINGVQILACVDDFGSNTCYFSRFLDNPNS